MAYYLLEAETHVQHVPSLRDQRYFMDRYLKAFHEDEASIRTCAASDSTGSFGVVLSLGDRLSDARAELTKALSAENPGDYYDKALDHVSQGVKDLRQAGIINISDDKRGRRGPK